MRAIAAAAVLGVLLGCAKENATEAAGVTALTAAKPTREVPSTFIGESWDAMLSGQIGATVTLKGEFFGGDRTRVCEYAATTRPGGMSAPDWVLRKDGRCVWVSQAMKVFGDPEEMLKEENVGRAVEITAEVVTDTDGKVYLRVASD